MCSALAHSGDCPVGRHLTQRCCIGKLGKPIFKTAKLLGRLSFEHTFLRRRGCLRGRLCCRAAVGIDLGSTNSIVSIVVNGQPEIVLDPQGRALLPSIVRYTDDAVLVGHEAQGGSPDPENTCLCAKRLIGRHFEDVEGLAASLPYSIVQGGDGKALIDTPAAGQVSPEQVSAEILKVGPVATPSRSCLSASRPRACTAWCSRLRQAREMSVALHTVPLLHCGGAPVLLVG